MLYGLLFWKYPETKIYFTIPSGPWRHIFELMMLGFAARHSENYS
jgi:hypothetical protein